MKGLVVVAFLLSLIGSIANAETFQLRKVMICDKAEVIFSKLAQEFNEFPQWGGKDTVDATSSYVLTVNPETGAWTLVQYDKVFACVLGVGTESKVKLGNSV